MRLGPSLPLLQRTDSAAMLVEESRAFEVSIRARLMLRDLYRRVAHHQGAASGQPRGITHKLSRGGRAIRVSPWTTIVSAWRAAKAQPLAPSNAKPITTTARDSSGAPSNREGWSRSE